MYIADPIYDKVNVTPVSFRATLFALPIKALAHPLWMCSPMVICSSLSMIALIPPFST